MVATAPAPGQFRSIAANDAREFIGIDLGLSMGVAHLTAAGAVLRCDTWDFHAMGKKAHPGDRVNRAHLAFGRWLPGVVARIGAGNVVLAYERVRRHEGVEAAHAYGGLLWVLLAECDRVGVRPETVEVSEIKRCAVGAGGGEKARKPNIVTAAQERWHREVPSPDAADALWIAEVLRRRTLGVAW